MWTPTGANGCAAISGPSRGKALPRRMFSIRGCFGTCRSIGPCLQPVFLCSSISDGLLLDFLSHFLLHGLIRLLRCDLCAIAQLNHLHSDELAPKLFTGLLIWDVNVQAASLNLGAGIGYDIL